MVLKLKDKGFLRLRSARGLAIEVVDGRVWITEDGYQGDRFLAAGGRYQVCGDGWCWSAPRAMKRIFEFFRRAWPCGARSASSTR